jgi:hypothetical protein
MKKIYIYFTLLSLMLSAACKKDSDFLDVPPKQVIPEETAFSDPALVLAIIGDLYNRQLDFSSLDGYRLIDEQTDVPGWKTFADFSESFPSENGSYNIVQRSGWDFKEWYTWDYTYVRDMNLFIERATASSKLSEADKTRFIAEARFLRANYYFELVKRMGGVPLITSSQQYNYDGNVGSLQIPRSKESESMISLLRKRKKLKRYCQMISIRKAGQQKVQL